MRSRANGSKQDRSEIANWAGGGGIGSGQCGKWERASAHLVWGFRSCPLHKQKFGRRIEVRELRSKQ